VTTAEYTQMYIDYLQKKNNVTIADDFDLIMNMFGPFLIDNPGDLKALGGLIKVLLNYAVDAVLEAIQRSRSAETADPFTDTDNVVRPLADVDLNREQDESSSGR
jgi:hypothetical protein